LGQKPKGTRYLADMKTYANLPARLRNKKTGTVVLVYSTHEPRTWAQARDICVGREMSEGTFKKIDAELKRMGVIRPIELKLKGEVNVRSALHRRREHIAEDITMALRSRAATSSAYPDDVNSFYRLAGFFQDLVNRINENGPLFEGMPDSLRPSSYFEGRALDVVFCEGMTTRWLSRVRDWLEAASE